MSEHHEVTEPPTDEAYYRGRSRVLNQLVEWLIEERATLEPSTARWRTLADVTTRIHELLDVELGAGCDE